MKKWFLVLLMLAMPTNGLAAQENTVVALPTVAPLARVEVQDTVNYTSAPNGEYYASLDEEFDSYQLPHMTAEERERARTLRKDYEAGARPEQNVLNKMEAVVVGVYTLDPVDYEGETLFTLLPLRPLTDEEILEVIDAFAQCGQMFDPDALTYKNCMRGGGIEASRFYQEEERNRKSVLRDMYIRMGFVSAAPYTPLVADDGLGIVTLNDTEYSGLDSFLFLPYRQMTDDELLSYIIYSDTGNPADYGNYAAYEKQLRQALSRLLGAPLTMTMNFEISGVMGDFDVNYDDEKVYNASFSAPGGTGYSGYLNTDTSEVLFAWFSLPETLAYSDLHLDPFDEKWLTVARETVRTLRSDGKAIADAQSMGEVRLYKGGFGVMVAVTMEDGGFYRIIIAYQNEAPASGIEYRSHAPSTERMYGTGQE